MKKEVKRWLLVPMTAVAVFSGALAGIDATTVNPYSNVKTINVSGQAEADYIRQKTDQAFAAASTPGFTPTASALPTPDKYAVPNGWKQEVLNMNGVSVEKYTPEKSKTDRIVFFIHGGGYVGGLHDRYRDWGIHQGELAGDATVLMLDYRIAPEHVYPAALEDAVNAYTGVLAAGYDPDKMILVGDSAGGNLASALAVYARDHKIPLPKSMVLISPWTDVDMAGIPTHTTNFTKDQILGEKNKRLGDEIKSPSYAKGGDPKDPYLSTSYADLTGLPPMLITAGGDELLLDDAALFAAHGKAAGVDTTFTVYPGMSHDWTILLPELPQSAAHDKEIRDFINQKMK